MHTESIYIYSYIVYIYSFWELTVCGYSTEVWRITIRKWVKNGSFKYGHFHFCTCAVKNVDTFESPYVLCKVSFLQPASCTDMSKMVGILEGGGVVRVCQQRNQIQVCFHCLNSPIFLSPLCFPGRGWHRNPSKAFYQAFQSGSRLRDSKAHSDRYGTILDWAGWACKSATTCVQCSAATSFAFFFPPLHVHGLSLKTKLGSQCRIGQ